MLLVIVILAAMTPFGAVFLAIVGIRRDLSYLGRSDVYQPVGRLLALYCQSDPKLFPRTLGPEWFPAQVDRIGHCWGRASPDGARIEFGGGFEHYGYSLSLDKAKSRPGINVWQLRLYDERSDRLLQQIPLPSTQGLSPGEVLAQVSAGCDRQIEDAPGDEARSVAFRRKIAAVLRCHRPDGARVVCAQMLARLPDDWWARILDGLVVTEQKGPAEGEKVLTTWVSGRPDFFKWLDLAYYYELEHKPAQAARAMVQATHYDANVDWGHDGNAEYRGYPAALYAFRSGQYDAAMALCDKLLGVTVNGQYAKAALTALRSAAQKRARGQNAQVQWSSAMTPFEPFKDLDLDALLGVHPTSRKPAR